MFTRNVNAACKHLVENAVMHETAKRLFDAILVVTNSKVDGFVSPGQVASFLNESPAVVTNWKSRGVSKDGRLKAHAKAGINPTWISTGDGEMLSKVLGHISVGSPLGAPGVMAYSGNRVAAISDEDHLSDDYIQIRESAVRFAAGNGRQAQFDEVAESVPRTYRRNWFTQQGINPDNARCFKVHGDSMEPLVYDGDTVLVNLAEQSITNGKVYAIRYGEELRIKRVYRKIDGGLVLHSDNPAFLPRDEEVPPGVVREHISIIGRVRDKSGTGGL
jgi:phage repressor protein C with HTH and peptisase S24 domain